MRPLEPLSRGRKGLSKTFYLSDGGLSMARAMHAPIGRAAVVSCKVCPISAVQGLGQRSKAQLLHGVCKEAHRPVALHAVLAQLCSVPASGAQWSEFKPDGVCRTGQ